MQLIRSFQTHCLANKDDRVLPALLTPPDWFYINHTIPSTTAPFDLRKRYVGAFWSALALNIYLFVMLILYAREVADIASAWLFVAFLLLEASAFYAQLSGGKWLGLQRRCALRLAIFSCLVPVVALFSIVTLYPLWHSGMLAILWHRLVAFDFGSHPPFGVTFLAIWMIFLFFGRRLPAFMPRRLAAFVHSRRGTALRERVRRQGGSALHLENAVGEYRKAVCLTRIGEPEMAGRLNNLSNGLRDLYQTTGNNTFLEEAIDASRRAVRFAPFDNHHLRSLCLNNLGTSLVVSYFRTERARDLQEAVDVYQLARAEAERLSPADSPELPLILAHLSDALRRRYVNFVFTQDTDDLDQAINYSEEALALGPIDNLDRAAVLDALGSAWLIRYRRLRRATASCQTEWLDKSIQCLREARELVPLKSQDYVAHLSSLGEALISRYLTTLDPHHLEEAIECAQEAVDLIPVASPYRLPMLESFHDTTLLRYGTAIQAFLGAATWPDSRTAVLKYPELLSDGAAALLKQMEEAAQEELEFGAYGTLSAHRHLLLLCRNAGIDRAFSPWGEGCGTIERNLLGEFVAANTDAFWYINGYDHSALNNSVDTWNRILNAAEFPRAPARFRLFVYHDAAKTLYTRALTNSGRVSDDLERAEDLIRKARALSAENAPDRAFILHAAGIILDALGRKTNSLQRLHEAIEVLREAATYQLPGSPGHFSALCGLGCSLMHRYEETNQRRDLDEALQIFKGSGLFALAMKEANDASYSAEHAVRFLAELGSGLYNRYERDGEQKDLDETLLVYDRVLLAIDRTFPLLPVADQVVQQGEWSNIYARAVDSHHKAGRYMDALRIAEGSKSRLLSAVLTKGHLPVPFSIPAILRQQEKPLLASLVHLDKVALSAQALGQATATATGELARPEGRRQCLSNLRKLWENMESYGSDAHNYVALRRADRPDATALWDLSDKLGTETAILTLFIGAKHSLAFVMRADKRAPLVLEWPIGRERWKAHVMGLDVPSRIGHGPWEPLLPLLQQIAAQVTGVQQVIVVPHADTHSLPWGALAALAGWQVPVTTVPALGLLARLQEREPSQGSDALVVGNPNGKYTSGKPDLPFAVYEAKNVANTLGVSAICEENATKKAVLTGLRNARIAHFACHAEFSPDDPFDSGIILADGKLTAREIMQSGERVPEFVALSACTTGNVNPVAGDELAGLSQAFLYSGAKAVLVSLWPVDDSATVALMKAFYGKWCNRGTDKATALYQAMATTRRVEEWSDLYYWGGFILVGDGR